MEVMWKQREQVFINIKEPVAQRKLRFLRFFQFPKTKHPQLFLRTLDTYDPTVCLMQNTRDTVAIY